MKEQASDHYWERGVLSDRQSELVVCAQNDHCSIIKTTTASKQASKATSNRNFPVMEVSSLEELRLNQGEEIISLMNMQCQFELVVVRIPTVNTVMQAIKYDVLDAFTKHSDISCVMKRIDEAQEKLTKSSESIDKEIQFNAWMGKFLSEQLTPKGFTVQSNTMNKNVKPNVCEYSGSKADNLIWHPNSFHLTSVEALAVRIIEEFENCELFEVSGEVIEMKSDAIDEKSINECFYTMFGCATKLITIAVSQGRVVNRAVMFGIVCNMKLPQSAIVLKLDVNIDERHCHFFRLSQRIPFGIALNSILAKLKIN